MLLLQPWQQHKVGPTFGPASYRDNSMLQDSFRQEIKFIYKE